jgi:histone H3
VDSSQVGIFEQWHKICLSGFLQRHNGRRLESEVSLTNNKSATSHTTKRSHDITLKSCAISRTSRWKGSLRMSSSVDFWYRRISRSATVPGLNRCGFLTPPAAVA